MTCAILFTAYAGGDPKDSNGCHRPSGHEGPHEFVADNGTMYQWETDWSCDCEHCQGDDGDWCTVYWPATTQGAQDKEQGS